MKGRLCPWCRRELEGDMAIPAMSWRRSRIYEAVAAAGRKGIKPKELEVLMYRDGRPKRSANGVLRVQVHEINKLIKPLGQHIRGSRDIGYHME